MISYQVLLRLREIKANVLIMILSITTIDYIQSSLKNMGKKGNCKEIKK